LQHAQHGPDTLLAQLGGIVALARIGWPLRLLQTTDNLDLIASVHSRQRSRDLQLSPARHRQPLAAQTVLRDTQNRHCRAGIDSLTLERAQGVGLGPLRDGLRIKIAAQLDDLWLLVDEIADVIRRDHLAAAVMIGGAKSGHRQSEVDQRQPWRAPPESRR